MSSITRAGMLVIAVVALATAARGQDYDRSNPAGGPFSQGEAVLNAPFSADATTRVQMLLADGTSRVVTVTARYYRDSQGRVRAELDTNSGPYVIIEVPFEPRFMRFYTLDVRKRTYRDGGGYHYAALLFNGEGRFAVPLAHVCFLTAPPVLSNVSDDERLRAVNAQVSPDLGIVTASHRSDTMPVAIGTVGRQMFGATQIAAVDYQVTNIRRDEPSADLFDILNYTFVRGSYDDPLLTFPSLKSGAMRVPPPGCNAQTR